MRLARPHGLAMWVARQRNRADCWVGYKDKIMTLANRLKQQLNAASVSVTDVSIGRSADKSTWLVEPSSLQAEAQPIIDAYVDPTPAQLSDEDAERETTNKRIMAVALALWECIPAPTMTKAQLRSRAKAIYKGLV